MSTQHQNRNAVAYVPQTEVTLPESESQQLAVIRNTYYGKDITDDEFKVLCLHADQVGLSVINREIMAIKIDGKVQVYVTVAGLRALAVKSGQFDGQDGPYWAGPDGRFKEVWLDDAPPAAAMVRVYRKGVARPFTGIALWKERKQEHTPKRWDEGQRKYVPTGQPAQLTATWAKMPAHMLAKIATADAIKAAGLVTNAPPTIFTEDEGPDGSWQGAVTVQAEEERKAKAMQALHGAANKKGLTHEQARGVVKAIVPGAASLNDESVTAGAIFDAAGVISEFDQDAVETIAETGEMDLADAEIIDVDSPITPREEWRIQLRDWFTDWNPKTSAALKAAITPDALWKWEDAVELAPTPTVRDRFVAVAEAAGVNPRALEQANSRRQDGTQIRRAAEKAQEQG